MKIRLIQLDALRGLAALTDGITVFDSLHYLSFFIFGMLLARHRQSVIKRFQFFSRTVKWGLAAASFVFYTYGQAVQVAIKKAFGLELSFGTFLFDHITAVGVAGFIVLALGARRVGAVLETRCLSF